MVRFYAFPVIFIDTVLFKKGTLIKRAGIPFQDTLDTPLDPPAAPEEGKGIGEEEEGAGTVA